ncbi:Extracellular serine-rich protein [Colletotrichum sidae]|uniref:Extracellular serine-rich protein n=4 Tax=Colletotrichum orbiculare species complex TaxID=2707354 RepID=N4UUV5_COLOR|nr:Extracellular serine-rich protein [Colletotrichum orbiculare MAFF 240422]TDZ32794.1 Extracellular serine-rich protein [Colletotrichum spinosum]TDZ68027.1 Extracellular serine-rich protein [Colletotrichum trifolii]TEA21015.1 Extracellular serine-rich protein [Colletotrichum sidae]
MHISAVVVSALAAVAQAVDVQVVSVASTNNTLKFFPDKINAPVGSMVQFQFRGGNHSVVQSTFDNPCIPISNVNTSAKGIYSGYQPVQASSSKGQIPVFTIQVNSSTPMWLYCSQGKHCQNGMVMVINENSKANASRTLENYAKGAKAVPAAQIPGGGAAGGSPGGASPTGGAGGGSNNGGGGAGNGGGSNPGGGAGTNPSSPPTAGAVSLTAPGTLLLALGAAFMLM